MSLSGPVWVFKRFGTSITVRLTRTVNRLIKLTSDHEHHTTRRAPNQRHVYVKTVRTSLIIHLKFNSEAILEI